MVLLQTIFRWVIGAIVWLALLIGTLWTVGALWFDFPIAGVRHALAVSFGVGAIALLVFLRPRSRAKIGVAIAIVLVVAWWFTLKPRQDRDWKPEVAVLGHATIEGERVTIHNVRNIDYRTETDFTPRYDTRSYDLQNLRGVDLFVTYWGSPSIAHPIFSFDFGEDGRVCFSIETRSQRGQSYSAIGGLYRQFEQIYIASDERDVIRLRSNFRQGEDVYLYRFVAPPQAARAAFLEYIRTLNELHERPRWYNAIVNNCTTAIRQQRTAAERAPWDWRMLANGYADEMLYERGTIERFALPFDELKRRAHINARARAANDDPAISPTASGRILRRRRRRINRAFVELRSSPGIGPKSTRRTMAPPPKLEPMSSRSIFSSSRKPLAFAVIAAGLFSFGCGRSTDRPVEQTVEQIYEIDSTGIFGLRNSAGSVRIQGSDDASMKLKTTKKAWSAEQLNAIAARVSVQTKSVSIETSFPPQKTWRFSDRSGSVDYTIILPRALKIARLELGNGDVSIEGMRGDVRADVVNGVLAARNCFGNIQLSVAQGGLDLFYEKWVQRFTVDAKIISGNARVLLPRTASFHLLAETSNGNVSNHFGESEGRNAERATRVNMSIGPEPHPEITLRATNGDIEIAAAKLE